MPYLWEITDELPINQIGIYDREIGPDRFIFSQGREIGPDLGVTPVVRFPCDKFELSKLDCLWTDGRVPLVSQRLRTLLEDLVPRKVEFFDIRIFAEDEEILGYYILNATRMINVIDVDKSEYRTVPGSDRIMAYEKIQIRSDFSDGIEFGRESSYFPYLFAGRELADAILNAGFGGMDFSEPEQVCH